MEHRNEAGAADLTLPGSCPTCGAERVDFGVSRRHVREGIESAEYRCGGRLETYRSHGRVDAARRCPTDPVEVARRAREAEIDRAVAAALDAVGATRAEAEELPRRMERDKGWSLRRDEGVWALLGRTRQTETPGGGPAGRPGGARRETDGCT